jgi:hypothetical protein
MNWLTIKAIKRINRPVLWRGGAWMGKTTGITQILKDMKYIKISINGQMNSNKLINALLPQILNKKN